MLTRCKNVRFNFGRFLSFSVDVADTSSHTSAEHHSADEGASSSQSTKSAAAAEIVPTAGHKESNLVSMRPVSHSAGDLPNSYIDDRQPDTSVEVIWPSVEGIAILIIRY